MIQTTIGILERSADFGIELGTEPPDTLTYEPIENCPYDFRETLRAYKPQLLALLHLPFCMVYSRTLEQNVFFCEDEETKDALVAAGADEWSIYTRDELQILVENNRVKPFLPDELCKLHEIKRTFNGRIK